MTVTGLSQADLVRLSLAMLPGKPRRPYLSRPQAKTR